MARTTAASVESLYPAAPNAVPGDLTQLPAGYKRQVFLVLCCLYLFVAVYLILLAGASWLVYWTTVGLSWSIKSDRGRDAAFYLLAIKGPAMLASTLLWLFLVKGLFKRPQRSRETMIELKKQEHPRLFAFVRQLCQEARAPFPKRIYVNHDVNAAVFYDASILGLFWPVRKNLLIGLGLVNSVNLSELKAALAHEFGHFSQSAMKLGSYVYTANRLILAMVYERDKWDDFLDAWKEWDIRISWLAYGLSWCTWALRKLLSGLFYLINIAQLGLSRQMEFHADKVAVSLAGSEALVRCLYKLEPGMESLLTAMHDLYWTSERQLYSRDLYYHQTKALERLRKLKNDPHYGLPPPISPDPAQRRPLFRKDKQRQTSTWDTHPPDYLRERRACQPYISAPQDERSPWLLFGRNEAETVSLREKMTLRVYRNVLGIRKKNLPLQEPQAIQQEIDAEQEAITFDPKYQGFYDERFLFTEHIEDWVQEVELNRLVFETLSQPIRQIFSQDWRPILQQWGEAISELGQVEAIVEGKLKPAKGKFHALGREWPAAQAKRVMNTLKAKLQQFNDQFQKADKLIFQYHYALAGRFSKQAQEALLSYYRWLRQLEQWAMQLRSWASMIEAIEEAMSADPDFARQHGSAIVETFAGIRRDLEPIYLAMYQKRVPKLIGLTEQPRVSEVLFPKGLVPIEPNEEVMPLGKWLRDLSQQVCSGRARGSRLYARSVSTILTLQQEIESRYQKLQNRPVGGRPEQQV